MVKMIGSLAAAALMLGLALPGTASAADSKRADGLTNGTPQITDVSSQRRVRRRHVVRRYHRHPRYYPRAYRYPRAYAYAPYPYYYPYYYRRPGVYFGAPGFGFGFRF